MNIDGVGPDAETVVNEAGGKQSHTPYRFDLIDPISMFELAKILASGAEKYGDWNWLMLDVQSNLNHALQHIFAYLAGDAQDDHLGHALCRLMFAVRLDHAWREVPDLEERIRNESIHG